MSPESNKGPNPGDNGKESKEGLPASRLPPPLPPIPPFNRDKKDPRKPDEDPRGERRVSDAMVEIPITELEFLRFKATKMASDNLVLQEAKIKSDEKICELSRQVLEHMKKEENLRTDQVYRMTGIETGDHVIQKPNGEFVVFRKKAVPVLEKR